MPCCVLPLAALVLLHALDGATGTRPDVDLEDELRVDIPPLVSEDVPRGRAARVSSVRQAFNATAIATGLPVWAVRAAAWPVMMHPGVTASLAALDMAVSYANLSDALGDAAKSYVQKPLSLIQRYGGASDPASDFIAANGPVLGVVFIFVFLGVMLSGGLLIGIIFPCVYKCRVTDQRPDFPDEVGEDYSMAETHDFHHKALTWCGLSTCLYACLCPAVRHADTLKAAGVGRFWVTIFIFMAVEMIFGATYSFEAEEVTVGGEPAGPATFVVTDTAALVRGLLFAAIFVWSRRALRVKFGSPEKGSLFWDCLCWAFCMECTVAQEGREVDAAQGVRVSCLCRATDLNGKDLVGEPVLG